VEQLLEEDLASLLVGTSADDDDAAEALSAAVNDAIAESV